MSASLAAAENIDPTNDDSQYAYAENVGWLNAEPENCTECGIHVSDFELTGWMWGENVGWLSLSHRNTTWGNAPIYGVINDGGGTLSGYAWAENVGWVSFSPSTGGVVIDVATGDFSGNAWGENIGWISFASTGANPFKVTTGWNCDPVPAVPVGSPTLHLYKAGHELALSWTSIVGETGYDVIRGDLDLLIGSGGDFSTATTGCLENNGTTALTLCSTGDCAGNALWFLVRGVNCAERIGLHGTFDSAGVGQAGLRDAEIAASGNDCP